MSALTVFYRDGGRLARWLILLVVMVVVCQSLVGQVTDVSMYQGVNAVIFCVVRPRISASSFSPVSRSLAAVFSRSCAERTVDAHCVPRTPEQDPCDALSWAYVQQEAFVVPPSVDTLICLNFRDKFASWVVKPSEVRCLSWWFWLVVRLSVWGEDAWRWESL